MNRDAFWWALIIVCIFVGASHEAESSPQIHWYEHQGRMIAMDCTRWAQMYHTASTMGTDNFEAWLNNNIDRFDRGELVIYRHEIKSLVKRRNGVPVLFPQAMLACGEQWM